MTGCGNYLYDKCLPSVNKCFRKSTRTRRTRSIYIPDPHETLEITEMHSRKYLILVPFRNRYSQGFVNDLYSSRCRTEMVYLHM